jgi:hypothetical protein
MEELHRVQEVLETYLLLKECGYKAPLVDSEELYILQEMLNEGRNSSPKYFR